MSIIQWLYYLWIRRWYHFHSVRNRHPHACGEMWGGSKKDNRLNVNKSPQANDDETHVMVIQKSQTEEKLTFQIGKETITESESEKLLGIHVSNNLRWEQHLSPLLPKLRHRLFTLRRIKGKLPNHLLKRVADGIFMSQVRYGLPLYCPVKMKEEDPTPGWIDKLTVAFNDCLRLITGNTRQDHTSIKNMLEELDWLSLNQLSAETRLIQAWNTAHVEDYCLQDTLTKRRKGSYSTRGSEVDHFEPGEDNRITSSGSFVNQTAKLWNQAPIQIKSATTLEQAKSLIRSYVKTLPIS